MEENRFFRLVWRINGVAILLVLLFIMGVGAIGLVTDMISSHDQPAVITNIAADPAGEEKWSLGSIEEIDGTQFAYIPLTSEKKNIAVSAPVLPAASKYSYGRGYFAPSRNLLFINKQTREMSWLFKNNGQLIAEIDMLSFDQKSDQERKVDLILYRIIKRDTNGDSQLSSEDVADIAISYPDGSRYTEIIPTVDRIFGTLGLEGNEFLILYQSKGKGYAATIRLQDMSVQETREMPRTEQAL